MAYLSLKSANYEVIKKGTKKAEHLYNSYKWSMNYYGTRNLWHCYERPSQAKECAYEDCVGMLSDFEGCKGYTVISYNCMQFTFGSIVWLKGIVYLMYITKAHNYLVEL